MENPVSDAWLMTLGAQSARWPDHQSRQWTHMRQVISDARAELSSLGEAIAKVNSDRDLTSEAKARRIAKAKADALARLGALPSLMKAEGAVNDFLATHAERRPLAIKAPSTPNEIALAAEIRAWVAKQPSPLMAVNGKMSDPAIVSAVLSAPGFLSGLSDEHFATLKSAAEEAIDPEAVEIRKQNEAALAECRQTVAVARERVTKLVSGDRSTAPTSVKAA